MYGAIIGDFAGSIYEYDQTKKISHIDMGKIIEDKAFYSDDTILTMAVLDAILNDRNYEKYLRKYIIENKNYKPNFTPYFKTPFSLGTTRWSETSGYGMSCGNGAMMRISPVGYLFNTESEVKENARLATIPSHNSFEAIDAATTIALIIYYLRKDKSIEYIYSKLGLGEPRYKAFYEFNTSCSETLENCLFALYNTDSFKHAMGLTLFMGGDTDTNCAIVGSMAEAMYGVDKELIDMVNDRIPYGYVKLLEKAYNNM